MTLQKKINDIYDKFAAACKKDKKVILQNNLKILVKLIFVKSQRFKKIN